MHEFICCIVLAQSNWKVPGARPSPLTGSSSCSIPLEEGASPRGPTHLCLWLHPPQLQVSCCQGEALASDKRPPSPSGFSPTTPQEPLSSRSRSPWGSIWLKPRWLYPNPSSQSPGTTRHSAKAVGRAHFSSHPPKKIT